MKKVILTKSILFLSLIMLIAACNSDDPAPPSISANDFSTAIDENQTTGTALGSIDATGTDGAITYSITSQTPNGALAIDATTGSLTVANENDFDFETNPTITANISVTGNTVTVDVTATVTLNDIDDIEFFLSTSKGDYTAATGGDWVAITETEYNDLTMKLNNVSRVGTTESQYTTTPGNSNTTAWTIANDAGADVPANSYVFAFKYYLNSGTDITGFKVKQSETIDDSYSDLGNSLPMHSGTGSSVYFVLKENSTQLNAQGYLAFYKPSGVNMGLTSGQNYYFVEGDVNTGFTQFDGYLFYQGLSTTQKQW